MFPVTVSYEPPAILIPLQVFVSDTLFRRVLKFDVSARRMPSMEFERHRLVSRMLSRAPDRTIPFHVLNLTTQAAIVLLRLLTILMPSPLPIAVSNESVLVSAPPVR